jgi:large subunit ribosomal protein L21
MFAVIEDGSRQYRVTPGEMLTVDYRADAKKGDTLTFDRVLLANGGGASAIGQPVIDGATVEAEVVIAEEKGPKLEVQKIRRRKNSRRHTGHRQKHTAVRVTTINVPGLEIVEPPPAPEPKTPPPAAEPETPPADETAPAADATAESETEAAPSEEGE